MTQRSTMEIISACKGAVAYYDLLCRGFLGEPNKRSIERKCRFLLLLKSIDKYAPTEALIKIYDFYKNENITTSRLRSCIQDALMIVLGITIPESGNNLARSANKLVKAEDELVRCVNELKQKVGMIPPSETLTLARGLSR
jgi:hypothetical protein